MDKLIKYWKTARDIASPVPYRQLLDFTTQDPEALANTLRRPVDLFDSFVTAATAAVKFPSLDAAEDPIQILWALALKWVDLDAEGVCSPYYNRTRSFAD